MSPPPTTLHVVKSVHSPAAAGFVASLTDATVVVIQRNPLSAVASWLELGWRPQRIAGTAEHEQRFGELVGASSPTDSAPPETMRGPTAR